MGQYFRFVALDNNNKPMATAKPYLFDNGAKLMEHSYTDSAYMAFFEDLFGKELYGSKLIWCGDYSKGSLWDDTKGMAETAGVVFKERIRDLLSGKIKRRQYRYALNLTKKLYINMEKITDVHPIPILCANSNGEGGGDFFGSNRDLAGTWSGDSIGFSNTIPEGFSEYIVDFLEF